MSFDVLPIEVLQPIFRYQKLQDLKSISLVCRQWATAVEPILAVRSRLAISHRAFSSGFRDIYAPGTRYDRNNDKPKELINILRKSNRRYTCLRVDWDTTITEDNINTLQELLELCRERFLPQKLHLRAFPCQAMTDLFARPCNWLENLTELHFEQCKSLHQQSDPHSTMEISLPKLKRLTWLEEEPRTSESQKLAFDRIMMRTDANRADSVMRYCKTDPSGSFRSATLDVPELVRLKIKIENKNETNWVSAYSHLGLEQPNDCCLFLPNLQLKSCSKLQYVCIEELSRLDQRLIARSKVWPNFTSLMFVESGSLLVERICRECSNLQELIVYKPRGYMSFENLSVLSRSLKKLTLNSVPIKVVHDDEVTFSELQHIRLIDMNEDCRYERLSQRLIAPNLTKIFILRPAYELLMIADEQETGTLRLDLNPLHEEAAILQPNVTAINLRLSMSYDKRNGTVQSFLNRCPNLRRLTISGKLGLKDVKLNLKKFPNLEYLCAEGFVLRLADFQELIHLKSLKLTKCTITANPKDGEIMLTELKYIRLEAVMLESTVNRTWDRFPIIGSDLQPATIVKTSANVFSSSDC